MNEHDPIATPLAALLAEHAGNVVLPHGSLVKVRRRAAQRRQRTRVAVSGGTVLAVGGFAALAVAGSRGPAPQMGVGDTTVTTPVNSGSTADSRPNLTPATPLAVVSAAIEMLNFTSLPLECLNKSVNMEIKEIIANPI